MCKKRDTILLKTSLVYLFRISEFFQTNCISPFLTRAASRELENAKKVAITVKTKNVSVVITDPFVIHFSVSSAFGEPIPIELRSARDFL